MDNPGNGRRAFLKWTAILVGWASAMATFFPTFMYLAPARGKKGSSVFVNPQGEPILAQTIREQGSAVGLAGGAPVIAIYYQGKIKVLSAVCTHLGCLVKWLPAESQLLCPCHAGKFDVNGQVLSGPPPAPLPQLAFTEEDGKIMVSGA
ncbi:MAG: QcrA and Rieske domain-containing protein [bacterium JZ-2024 1]